MLADKKIIAAIRSNDDDKVLHELYRHVKPKVVAYIKSNSGSLEEADDIFQDAVLVFYKQVKLDKFNEEYAITGFLYSVSRNLWINKAKRDQRSSSLSESEEQVADHSDALQDMITQERSTVLGALIKSLGENCEQILSMTYYQKISLKKIAFKLGYANEGAVKTRNYKCKQRLIKLMKEQNISQTAF